MQSRLILWTTLAIVTVWAQDPPDPVIEAARNSAAGFAQALPDYIVKRTTTRDRGARPDRRSRPDPDAVFWQTLDTVTGVVTAEHGQEVYSKITVNGKPAKSLPGNGAWSAGEFSAALLETLAPKSAAIFANQTPDLIRDHSAYRYDYEIDQAHSTWRMIFQKGGDSVQRYLPGYGGAIWIDMRTHDVLRITRSARAMPTSFGLDSFDSAIDYDLVKIGDTAYLLPIQSEDVMCVRGTVDCFRNDTVFEDYNKFGSKTSISFEDGGK